MLESAIQRHVMREARAAGCFVRKVESPNHAGLPDLVIVYQGRTLWLELKTDIGRLSALQERTHQEMRAAGAQVATTYGLDQALKILREFVSQL